ncbi:MAG: BON domain-containing protein [Burkholderiales bacterium]|nr:BON domain-containing protein [Burkholderiales bacterium]
MIDRNSMRRGVLAAMLCATAAAALQGCVAVATGGVVVGAMAASDRRTLGAQTEDKGIELKGESRISKLVGDAGHVNVSSYNRKALLTGEVKDEAMKAAVEREIGMVEGVQSVVNDVEIAGASSFASRSNDALITGKVKASFVDAKDLFANSFKVTTERGVVYLMGRVTEREAKRAAAIAAGVSGVRKVIKVFEYITEEELTRMSTAK